MTTRNHPLTARPPTPDGVPAALVSQAAPPTLADGSGGLPVGPAGTIPRRPMARASRITLFEREVRERLSRTALDLILCRADLLSEGQRAERGGRQLYFGSTMLTIDLPRFSDLLRDACDAATARRLAALMESDPDVPRLIREIAWREATRVLGLPLGEIDLHVAIRAQGAKVFIDVDVEAAPAPAAAAAEKV